MTRLIATNEEEMWKLFKRVEKESCKLGLRINRQKTKLMFMDLVKTSARTFLLRDIELIHNFVYLGFTPPRVSAKLRLDEGRN